MSNKFETTTIIFKEAMPLKEHLAEDSTFYAEDDSVSYAEDPLDGLNSMLAEEMAAAAVGTDDLSSVTVGDVFEPFTEGDESLGEMGDDLSDLDKDITDFIEEVGADTPLEDILPGSNVSSKELDEESGDADKERDYANDGDLTKFVEYVNEQYPGNIPAHDGRTTVGCERAVSFLDRMNSEISRAIREDHENVLDIQALEDVRLSIMKDILLLKSHLGKLKKKLKDEHSSKEASMRAPFWMSPKGEAVDPEDLKKEASTPRNIVIAVSPFERAISGIMINAHISAGHSIEDVYAHLADKYSINEREELAIMQLCMDSGFHIFKDRGTFSPGDKDGGKAGVDFVKNYFA